MNTRPVSLSICALLIGILACNLPGNTPTPTPSPENDLAATITAQAETLQAPSDTPGPPTETPTITPTGTPSVPMVSVSTATNCRTGNASFFDWLFTLDPGDEAEVVGKNADTGYWIIKYPGGQCWLWGQYATVTGDTSKVAEVAGPATPTPSIPAAPTNFNIDKTCTYQEVPSILYKVHVELSWTDAANNEDGYYVYREAIDGSTLEPLLATLDADSTAYADDTTLQAVAIPGESPPGLKYAVEAYNEAGRSSKVTKVVTCP